MLRAHKVGLDAGRCFGNVSERDRMAGFDKVDGVRVELRELEALGAASSFWVLVGDEEMAIGDETN